MTSADNRRRDPRREVTLFLCRGGADDLYLGIVRNIGSGGMFVETSEQLAVGSNQSVTFVCGGELRSCTTRVVRQEPTGLALEFSSDDAEAVAAVRELVGRAK